MVSWSKKEVCWSCKKEFGLTKVRYYHKDGKFFCKKRCFYRYERPHGGQLNGEGGLRDDGVRGD
jgi:hypothetical protein